MEYRVHQGLRLSVVGVGCYSLSGAYGRKDVAQFRSVLRRAYDLGVNLFDAAEAYGDAETVLGEVMAPFRDEVLVSTKVGVREGIKSTLSRSYVRKACEDSLRRLGTDWIDIYNVHFDDPDTPVAETVEALDDLVREGKIRRYGLGHVPLTRVEEYMQHGSVFSVLTEFSAVSRGSSSQLLPLCKRYGVAAIAFSVTGRGLLTGRLGHETQFDDGDIRILDPQFQRERLEFGLRVASKLREMGDRHGKTPVQMAIAWAISQPGITSVLTGPSSVDHLDENLGGAGWLIPDDDLQEINAYLDRQEEWLWEAQLRSLRSILHSDLPPDASRAFVDLIYCIETAIDCGCVEEAAVLPVFYRLYGMRSKLDQATVHDFESIRAELRELIALPRV